MDTRPEGIVPVEDSDTINSDSEDSEGGKDGTGFRQSQIPKELTKQQISKLSKNFRIEVTEEMLKEVLLQKQQALLQCPELAHILKPHLATSGTHSSTQPLHQNTLSGKGVGNTAQDRLGANGLSASGSNLCVNVPAVSLYNSFSTILPPGDSTDRAQVDTRDHAMDSDR